MILSSITLLSGLLLSLISAYYSISGLTAIFAAAVIPVIVMGGALEISKLVVTVWLKQYWDIASIATKIYLTGSVIVLMIITSVGCFGFLSKAHIEQVGVGQESAAQVQRITVELKRQTDIVAKAEERAKTLETSGTGADANVNSQIKTEQGRIDSALSRVQPAIDEQQKIIEGQTKLYSDQVVKIDEQLMRLQTFIDAKEVDKAQALVGVKADGDWGPGTARAVTAWQTARAAERTAALAKLEEANRDPTIRGARDEILRIRKTVEVQVAESNKLIDRLRNQLGKGDTASVEILVNEQQEKIKVANAEIETLTQQKYTLEAEYRKLEVEVGPIKYIAELVYGDTADRDMLERAVRWVIILIVAVFDPLAVMMMLAAQMSFQWRREELDKKSAASTIFETQNPATTKGSKVENLPQYEKDDGPLSDIQIKLLKEIARMELPVDKLSAKTDLFADNTTINTYEKDDSSVTTEQTDQIKETVADDKESITTARVEDADLKKKELHDQGSLGQSTSQESNITYVQKTNDSVISEFSSKPVSRAKDELYKLFGIDKFETLVVNKYVDPELFEFVKETRESGPHFSNYSRDRLEHFARRIYAIRKDNSNNSTR